METFNGMICSITENNINITDSYKITKKEDMEKTLRAIQDKYPGCNSFKRDYNSLINEWKAHNRLYNWGLWESHTKDVDLDYPAKWYTEIIYWVLSR